MLLLNKFLCIELCYGYCVLVHICESLLFVLTLVVHVMLRNLERDALQTKKEEMGFTSIILQWHRAYLTVLRVVVGDGHERSSDKGADECGSALKILYLYRLSHV